MECSDRPSWVRCLFCGGQHHLVGKRGIRKEKKYKVGPGEELQTAMGLYSVNSREPVRVTEWQALWSELGFQAFNPVAVKDDWEGGPPIGTPSGVSVGDPGRGDHLGWELWGLSRGKWNGRAGGGKGHMGLGSSMGWTVRCLLLLGRGAGVGPGAVMSSRSNLASLTHTAKCCVRERDLGLPARQPGAGRLGRVGAKRQP